MTITIKGTRGDKKNMITIYTEKKRMEIFVEENAELNPLLAKKISQEIKEGQYGNNVFDIIIEFTNRMFITSQNTIEEARAYAKGFQDAYDHQTGVALKIIECL